MGATVAYNEEIQGEFSNKQYHKEEEVFPAMRPN